MEPADNLMDPYSSPELPVFGFLKKGEHKVFGKFKLLKKMLDCFILSS